VDPELLSLSRGTRAGRARIGCWSAPRAGLQALTALRQALEPVELVVTDRDGVELRSGADLWVDAELFEDLVSRAQAGPAAEALIDQANALYVGDYLPEDLYEDWTTQRREALKRLWIELLFTVARREEARGEPERGGHAGTVTSAAFSRTTRGS
jgi:DNA-binding SARP family transcriptional activator